ncbi:hypothetical protein SASPL_105928 [Salvia splendens]|uniref:Uncharacterized protein n=1 Tax=Salvia splendens TaxID=180675 RepID=A0A8X8YK29_SALSN|nr:hypothetical protein SASPL_105928 [Salvia splendens]
MGEENVSEKGLTSAAAIVEGGIQDACDDSCSICLEAFCGSDPSTVEMDVDFEEENLRSLQIEEDEGPIRPSSRIRRRIRIESEVSRPNTAQLADTPRIRIDGVSVAYRYRIRIRYVIRQQGGVPEELTVPDVLAADQVEGSGAVFDCFGSQELLEGVEHERNIRMNPPRNSTIFHHPTLGDFELQYLPVSASESELEERIIQHLAAAAAMGRARHVARREGQRNRSSTQGRPQFVVFSTHPNGASAASPAAQREGGFPPSVMIAGPNSPFITTEDSDQFIPRILSAQADVHMATGSASNASPTAASRSSSNRSPPGSQDRAGPLGLHSFSETLKSRFSTRYKESITKTTRGWKEKLFTRNSHMPEQQPTPETRRESSQGIATVSHMMGHLEVSEDSRTTLSRNIEDGSSQVPTTSQPATETQAPCAAAGAASN